MRPASPLAIGLIARASTCSELVHRHAAGRSQRGRKPHVLAMVEAGPLRGGEACRRASVRWRVRRPRFDDAQVRWLSIPTKALRLPESIVLSALEELGCERSASPILCLEHALVNMFQIGTQ